MSKFKVGDEVVCIDKNHFELEYLKQYTIRAGRNAGVFWKNVQVEVLGDFYPEECFELFSEWASHQVPVSTETELALTKLQVKMLQDWKKENIKKVERYDWLRSTGKEQQNVIAHYGYEEMDKIIDKLMLLEKPNE